MAQLAVRCDKRFLYRVYLITTTIARASFQTIAGQILSEWNYTRRMSSRVHESWKLRGRCKIRLELLFRSTVTHKFATMPLSTDVLLASVAEHRMENRRLTRISSFFFSLHFRNRRTLSHDIHSVLYFVGVNG